MVSRPTRGTSLRLTTSSVSRRTVQRAAACRRRPTHQGHDALPLRRIQQGRFPGSRPLIQGPLQAAFAIASAGQPYRLRGQGYVLRHLPDGLPLGQLPQSQSSQHRSHRLQPTLQYPPQLLPFLFGQPNPRSLRHVPAIDQDKAYKQVSICITLYVVIVLVPQPWWVDDLAFHLDFLPPPSLIEPAFIYALAVSSFFQLRNKLTNPQMTNS